MKNAGTATQLNTKRLSLRRFTEDDVELMLAVWNDPAFIQHVGDRGIRSADKGRTALRSGILTMYDKLGYGPYRVALAADDEPIGICGLFKRDYLEDPDIGFALLPAFCGKGFAYEASCAVLEAAENIPGLRRITAIVSPGNSASRALLDKLGFFMEQRMKPPGTEAEVLILARSFR